MTPEPGMQELIDAAAAAVHGQGDNAADYVRGSDYESIAGPTAVIYTREARRDTDLFDATRFHTARGDDLTNLVAERYDVDRYLDTRGVGKAGILRPTAGGGAGTIWAGTRITIFGNEPKYYRTKADTEVLEEAKFVLLDIEAVEIGPGSAANQTTDIRIDDILWDTSFTAVSLQCLDGRKYESAPDLIARVRAGRRDARVGQKKNIEDTCRLAGAGQVLVLRSDYGGDALDSGLNVCYVGDAGWSSSEALVKACTLALRASRVLGDHMQVLQMGRANLAVSVDVYLRDIPQVLDTERLERIHRASISQYLGGTSGGFTFSKVGIGGAIARNTAEVQDVSVVTPASDVGILADGAFPAILNRYIISDIAIRYHGP